MKDERSEIKQKAAARRQAQVDAAMQASREVKQARSQQEIRRALASARDLSAITHAPPPKRDGDRKGTGRTKRGGARGRAKGEQITSEPRL